MKTIAIFGASGNTGKPLTEMALKEGYGVRALVRTPSKLGLQQPNLQAIQGDLTDPAKVEETIRGRDVVVSVIGAASGSPPDIKMIATQHIITAMHKHAVKRFIRIASAPFGVLDEGDRPNFSQKLMTSMAKTMMRAMVKDEGQSVDLIKQSDLDWTVVRAVRLNNQPQRGS